MIIRFVLFLVILINSASYNKAFADCERKAEIKYKQTSGWSKKYFVDVTFISGAELNSATSSFNYSGFSTYAIVFWGNDQATVIKITSFLACGNNVTCSCIDNTILDIKGIDQDGDEWNICLNNYCF